MGRTHGYSHPLHNVIIIVFICLFLLCLGTAHGNSVACHFHEKAQRNRAQAQRHSWVQTASANNCLSAHNTNTAFNFDKHQTDINQKLRMPQLTDPPP